MDMVHAMRHLPAQPVWLPVNMLHATLVHAAARCGLAGSKSRAVRARGMSVAQALGVLQAEGEARRQTRCMPHAPGSAAHQLSGLRACQHRRQAGPCADRQAAQAAARPLRGGARTTPQGAPPAA